MRVLLIGGGGREHALAWKMQQSPLCEALFISPGNAGTAELGENVDLSDFEAMSDFVKQQAISLLVVGPEAPLVEGIWDYFQEKHPNLLVIGPSKAAAQLEGSKAYAKAFMQEFDIPTAAYREFNSDSAEEGLAYIAQQTPPIVLKADGLAAGKGVLILDDVATAQHEFSQMLQGKFGDAGQTVVVEAFLKGTEFSVFALTDGENYQILPVAKDYKRIGEGDTGLNTGGMGAVSPVPFVDRVMMEKVLAKIVVPTVRGLQVRGLPYQGFIFFGLIEVNGEPFVIEYNCRMGDPETQVVMPRLQNDLLKLFKAIGKKKLDEENISINKNAATAVVMASGGYPQAYEKGKAIEGWDKLSDVHVFHAGTRKEGQQILSNGGRVLAVTGMGSDLKAALEKAKTNAQRLQFEGCYFRKDIGYEFL